MNWRSIPPRVLAAVLWPGPVTRLATKAEPWSGDASTATEVSSWSTLVEALPSDLLERLSPSHLAEWALCPGRALFHATWRPRWTDAAEQRDRARAVVVGSAVHAELQAHYQARQKSPGPLAASRIDVGTVANTYLATHYSPDDVWTLRKVQGVAKRAVEEALVAGVPPTEEVVAVEAPLGLGHPDLVTRTPTGLVVTDTKCHWEARPEKYVEEWTVSVQLRAYADIVSRVYGEPVEWYRVQEIALTPKPRVRLLPFRVTPEAAAFWRAILRDLTAGVIEEYLGQRPVEFRPTGCFRYGRCPAWEACHVYQWDPQQMLALYDPLDPTREVSRTHGLMHL